MFVFLKPRRRKKDMSHNKLKLTVYNPFVRACRASEDRFDHMIHATHHCFEESAQLQNLKTTHGSTEEVKQSWSPKNAQHLGVEVFRFEAMNTYHSLMNVVYIYMNNIWYIRLSRQIHP